MTRKKVPPGRDSKAPSHARIHHWVTKTEAWRALSVNERYLYLLLLLHRTQYNNGAIRLSVRQAAADMKAGSSTVQRAFEGLEKRGFIKPIQKGAFSLKARHCTEWLITEHANDITGELAEKTFTRWTANMDFEESRPHKKQKPVPTAAQTVPTAAQSVPTAAPIHEKRARTVSGAAP